MASLTTAHASDHAPQHNFQLTPPTYDISPSSDAPNVPKSRRKRTSPRDHAILEAAYLRNSKPDKAERAVIVSQVDLGEKEVQIWFQNRRQNDRRKSKPLQPHELVAHLRTHTSSPVPLTGPMPRPSSLAPIDPPNRPASRASSIQDLLNPSSEEVSPRTGPLSSQVTRAASTPPSSIEHSSTSCAASGNPGTQEKEVGQCLLETSSREGSAKKRSHDEMSGLHAKEGQACITTAAELPPREKEPLKRTASMVRLAMTVDGAVKIRTNNEPTPSPEKPRSNPSMPPLGNARPALARSKSSTSEMEIFRESGQMPSKQPGSGFGRSRDSRRWEFFCDNTAQDALSKQAEAETNGSAISAIHLVRSNSFKARSQALSPSVSKSNPRVISSGKEEKRKLARTKSSLARLQSADGVKENPKSKSKSDACTRRSSGGDSDKENWAPGTRASVNPLRRTDPSANHRPVLRENEGVIFPDASPANANSTTKPQGHHSMSDWTKTSPSKDKAHGEELDCIHGLLSLSQGAWK
ncbi:hypothetical protein B0A52_04715 [Exophiala mesophila]|uniref:Homeobox domain-containing protein n=1 Tax=Exophiala mesophila TaxID=212818 RepID=A0A438N8L8_EXOME|nr:hypothetical protein B0A52_04715 [Exophiala mesophila]